MPDAPVDLDSMSSEAFASLSSMEGLYEPIVEITYVGPLTDDAYASFGSMEGIAAPVVAPVAPTPAVRKAVAAHWPGYLFAGATAVAAYGIHYLPIAPFQVSSASGVRHPISAAIIAILVGLAIRNFGLVPKSTSAGCKKTVKKVIPIAIVLTGGALNLAVIANVGLGALAITIACIAVAFGAAHLFGKWFGISSNTALLIGAGSGICGTSAIIAVAPLIDADDEDLALSVGTINLFGLIAMLLCPLIGTMLHMSDQHFGVWSGTTIHAVPQVVAAGYAFSADAGTLATLVKLVRVTLLAPLIAGLAILYAHRHSPDKTRKRGVVVHYARLVPWFIWGFVVLAILNTVGLIPTLHFHPSDWLGASTGSVELPLANVLKQIAKILLTLAMAAIGLELNLHALVRVGSRALITGLAVAVVLAGVSFALVSMLL